MEYVCKWCGKTFTKKHNREQYCCDKCRYEARLESKRKYRNKKYRQNKVFNTCSETLTRLGSYGTNTRVKPLDDFKEEYRSIRREFRMIGFKV